VIRTDASVDLILTAPVIPLTFETPDPPPPEPKKGVVPANVILGGLKDLASKSTPTAGAD
jgi:hypothetical protein